MNSNGDALTTTSFSVGVGTTAPLSKFHLENGDFRISENNITNILFTHQGLIRAREIKIDLDVIPDYVFASNYSLMNLYELEKYINKYKHLPNIPSQSEYNEQGAIDIGKLQLKLLEKIEELTLYVIQLKKENDALKERIVKIEKKKN